MLNPQRIQSHGKPEVTLTFTKKPLGIGLVPSTQLYGAWEVGHAPKEFPELEIGDVLLAVNENASVNRMDVSSFRAFIARLPCPLTITFRKPRLYGHCDSHTTATALFPQSFEYTQFMRGSTRHGRASAQQWKQSLAHEDSKTKLSAKGYSSIGDIVYTFKSKAIGIEFAPSTRLYGSLEIESIDSKDVEAIVHPGDVLLALNDSVAAKWTHSDLEHHLQTTTAPFKMTFRNPRLHLQYLRRHFEAPNLASTSVSRAMFPATNEYKKLQSTGPEVASRNEWHTAHAKLRQNNWLAYYDKSVILKKNHVHILSAALPPHVQCSNWKLLFTTQSHGFNMTTFYHRTQDKGPTIVAIKDSTGQVFGGKTGNFSSSVLISHAIVAFSPSSLRHTRQVYGNGRTFVFKHSTIYSWSGIDTNFIYGGPNRSIIWGGGASGLALCLQLDEGRGFTQPCLTFDSPPLTEPPEFECWAVEVWGFEGLKV
ncbi:hypothetical protein LEN26_011956 [Aphanomyces euteiches]|nr:hypothetical protein AeMF1_020155 [Aphanomyces euteiches]KAH9118745.1 hypothetical protein LEN26_011956 [Aphanomyces euteiches]KAH9186664.1 hypothetical protein AeNC1_011360 [Aphanomyces euteiches]